MEHLFTADEAITVEVVDEEGEGSALVGGSSQEPRQAANPFFQADHPHIATVEGTEYTIHEDFLCHNIEGVV